MADNILAGLNAEQIEAVTATEGYVRVIAGAGTGKTRALTHRFAYLVNELGILPGRILCATFTNKAASEMRRRIRALTGDRDTAYVCTFHSLCVAILQEDGHAVQYPHSFMVLDNADIDAMLEIIYAERGLTLRAMTYAKARDMIEMRKLFKEPEYYRGMLTMSLADLKSRYEAATVPEEIIFAGYLYQERKCFALDYNDLLKFSLFLFEENPQIRLKWQKRLEYIMVDEFQDIDGIQYELMQVLSGHHRNLFVVGDTDQTIYTWRGANVKYLKDFDQHFPGTRTIVMNRSYRSTPGIIAAANSLISRNSDRIKKELVAQRPAGAPVIYRHEPDQAAEAAWIAKEIAALCKEGVPPSSIAVLYRAHFASRSVEQALIEAKIPYALGSGVPFYERAEIKDAVSYLRMVLLHDDISLRRIVNRPRRNIGVSRMKLLETRAAAAGTTLYEALRTSLDDREFRGTGARAFVELVERYSGSCSRLPVSELLTALIDESGYEAALRTAGAQDRLDNLAELKQSVFDYETECGEELTVEKYLAHAALFTNADAEQAEGKVRLMTVHAAKGLEFPVVFLASLAEGIFPSGKIRTLEAMREERRLAFVAVTRAMDRLYLTESQGRNFDGSVRYPSRFILDIEPQLLTFSPACDSAYLDEARRYIRMTSTLLAGAQPEGAHLAAGTRVVHRIFGSGTVLAYDAGQRAYEIAFEGMATPRLLSERVKLELA